MFRNVRNRYVISRATGPINKAKENGRQRHVENGLEMARPMIKGLLPPRKFFTGGNLREHIAQERLGRFTVRQLLQMSVDELFQVVVFGQFHIRERGTG